MKRFILLPCLILVCIFITGCFGLVVTHPRQQCTTQFCLESRGMVTNGAPAVDLTEAQVLNLWGQPDSMRNQKDGIKVWHYQGAYSWGSFMPMYFIPVPLPFPAGHDYVEIYFKDGIAQKASRTVDVYTGAALAAPCNKGYMLGWEKKIEPDGNIK